MCTLRVMKKIAYYFATINETPYQTTPTMIIVAGELDKQN